MSLKKPKKNDDAVSAYSKFTSFSPEVEKSRQEIVKKGYIRISETTDPKNPVAFTDYFTELSKDGRLMSQKGKIKNSYIILSCAVTDGNIFRLIVKSESDLTAKGSKIELTCRVDDETECSDWLISIETTLRGRIQSYKNELDTARGKFLIKEIDPTDTKPTKDAMTKCECFYHEGSLRTRGLDGSHMSSFQVLGLHVDPIELPLCLIIHTQGRSFFMDTGDVDIFKKWSYAIEKDIDKKKAQNKKLPTYDMKLLQAECLMGPSPDKMVRIKAKYYIAERLLETVDYSGYVDSFYVERAIICSSKENKFPYNLMLMLNAKDEEADKALKFYLNLSYDDYKKWVPLFEVDMYKISVIMDTCIVQIELRRIVNSEFHNTDKSRPVTARELFHLMSLTKEKLENSLVVPSDWPLSRLERATQMLLQLPPEPLVPISMHEDFIKVGKDLTPLQSLGEAHYRETLDLVSALPHIRREILERLTVHIFRLAQHYHALKQAKMGQADLSKKAPATNSDSVAPEDNPLPSDPPQESNSNKRPKKANPPAATGPRIENSPCITTIVKNKFYSFPELMIWIRLGKYIFRMNEYMDDNVVAVNAPYAALVMLVFQKKYVILTSEQMTKSAGSGIKKKMLEEHCNQQ